MRSMTACDPNENFMLQTSSEMKGLVAVIDFECSQLETRSNIEKTSHADLRFSKPLARNADRSAWL